MMLIRNSWLRGVLHYWRYEEMDTSLLHCFPYVLRGWKKGARTRFGSCRRVEDASLSDAGGAFIPLQTSSSRVAMVFFDEEV